MTSALDEKIRAAALSRIPSQRFGTPDDVAAAVSFLVSPAARYINGQVLGVDGGLVI
jgi:3-oxoacyl-[acyl-carrier protein] reductase